MELAINYSPAAARLLQAGAVEVNRFKAPDWLWMIQEAQAFKPVAVHFTLDAGNAQLSEVNWPELERLAELTGTPYINLHLDARQKYHRGVDLETSSQAGQIQVMDTMLSDVMGVVERFGAERVIVENSPYRGEKKNTLRLCVEPEIISRVVAETGCGFLLDISHAMISAHYLGMDADAYFNRLPVGRIKEMHFAGIHLIDGIWTDHLSILETDWHRLEWVLNHILSGEWSTPWLLAFEYGGVGAGFEWRTDPQVIAEQLPRLYQRLRNFTDASPS